MDQWPLGKHTVYAQSYQPEVLSPIKRADSRKVLGLLPDKPLPFYGVDLWNAHEVSWLSPSGKPKVAQLVIAIPAETLMTVESKSLKLYLGSLACEVFPSAEALLHRIRQDLDKLLQVEASLQLQFALTLRPIGYSETWSYLSEDAHSICLDDMDIECRQYQPDAGILKWAAPMPADASIKTLYSHLFRSLCPVTGQPDWATVMMRYQGKTIDPASVLQYWVSFREHQGFHEACVERMFLEIKDQCCPEALSVYARFARRGGIDINPFRTDFEFSNSGFDPFSRLANARLGFQ